MKTLVNLNGFYCSLATFPTTVSAIYWDDVAQLATANPLALREGLAKDSNTMRAYPYNLPSRRGREAQRALQIFIAEFEDATRLAKQKWVKQESIRAGNYAE